MKKDNLTRLKEEFEALRTLFDETSEILVDCKEFELLDTFYHHFEKVESLLDISVKVL